MASVPVAESSGHGGRNTAEYKTIQSNLERIVANLKQEGVLHEVAIKVFEKQCITRERLSRTREPSDASDFMLEMLTRIDVDEQNFFMLMKALSEVPSIADLSNELTKKRSSLSNEDQVKVDQVLERKVDQVEDKTGPRLSYTGGVTRVANTDQHQLSALPPSSVYNGSSGLMSSHKFSASVDSSASSSFQCSQLLSAPVPTDNQRTDDGVLVSGKKPHNSGLLKQQEQDYQDRLANIEEDLRQLKESVHSKNTVNIVLTIDTKCSCGQHHSTFTDKIQVLEEKYSQLHVDSTKLKETNSKEGLRIERLLHELKEHFEEVVEILKSQREHSTVNDTTEPAPTEKEPAATVNGSPTTEPSPAVNGTTEPSPTANGTTEPALTAHPQKEKEENCTNGEGLPPPASVQECPAGQVVRKVLQAPAEQNMCRE